MDRDYLKKDKESGVYKFPLPVCKCCKDKEFLFLMVYGDWYYYSHREGDSLVYYKDKQFGV
jgi:hypothetical protein